MKSISAHTAPHLPITAATLMQILERAELASKLCIAMAMRTGRNPFFIDIAGRATRSAMHVISRERRAKGKTKHTQTV